MLNIFLARISYYLFKYYFNILMVFLFFRKPNEDVIDQEMAAQALPSNIFNHQKKIDINCAENFPSLGNASASNNSNLSNKSIAQRLAKNSGMTVRSSRGNPLSVEDFPSLSTTTNKVAIGSTSSSCIDGAKGNSSKQRNNNSSVIPNGNIESKSISKRDNKTKHQSNSKDLSIKNNTKQKLGSNNIQSTEDFPALSKADTTDIIPKTVASWIPHNTTAYSSSGPKSKKVEEINNNIKKQSICDSKSNFSLNEDFPSLLSKNPRSSSKSLPPPQPQPKGNVNNNISSKPKGNVNNKNMKGKVGNIKLSVQQNNSTKDKVSNTSSINKIETTTTVKNKKKKNLLSLVLTQNDDNSDGPVEDFTASRQGEYEAVIPNISSNINFISLDDIPSNRELKKKRNDETALSFSSNDFPSLVANKLLISSTDDRNSKVKYVSNNKNHKTDLSASSTNKKFTASNKNAPPGFTQHLQPKNSSMSNNNNKASEKSMKKIVTSSFTFPPNFDLRNRALIDSVRLACNDSAEKFNNFKITADKFRKNEFSGEQFYGLCRSIMGKLKFLKILPELLALLPDIVKQQVSGKMYKIFKNCL